ncbi:hypothetical protein [Spirosoma arcticum]
MTNVSAQTEPHPTALAPCPYLLAIDHQDRNGASEGQDFLLFPELSVAEVFARKLATDYFDCGPLPDEGDFETPRLKGDVLRYGDELTISWTLQPRTTGGEFGDSYYLTLQPVLLHTADTRLDFWNQVKGIGST